MKFRREDRSAATNTFDIDSPTLKYVTSFK